MYIWQQLSTFLLQNLDILSLAKISHMQKSGNYEVSFNH